MDPNDLKQLSIHRDRLVQMRQHLPYTVKHYADSLTAVIRLIDNLLKNSSEKKFNQ